MSLFIGLSALRTSQSGLDVISQNIANANNPSYHRQQVHLASLNDDQFRGRRFGSGVTINDIERIRHRVVESYLTQTVSETNSIQQRLLATTQIETLFLPGPGSLQDSLDSLFNDINGLADQPADATSRSLVIDTASQLSNQFARISRELNNLRSSLQFQIETEVENLNQEIEELRELNEEIGASAAQGGVSNGLLDRRDELVNSIAAKVNVSTVELQNGLGLTFGNYSIGPAADAIEFLVVEPAGAEIAIAINDEERDLSLSGGTLDGLVNAYNDVIPKYIDKLDELAASVIRNFDQAHATGIGTAGSFSRLIGTRSVAFPNTSLAQAGTSFPVQAGELYFSITDPDGNRRTESILVDPDAQSLQDITSLIDSIGGLSSRIDPTTNGIQISASQGFKFDFTGSLENAPDLSAFTGSARPQLSGVFNGDTNTEYRFEVIGSGAVGVSDNLAIRVTDAQGNLISEANIGVGYEAGTDITIADGISLNFSAGDVADGDNFASALVSNPDESGILSALGLNSFFNGHDASTIAVQERIINDSSLFSTSYSGDAAATAKLNEFANLQSSKLLNGNTSTLNEYLIDLTAEIGLAVNTDQRISTNLESLLVQYQREQASISGVDVNEELVQLTQYQKSYEAAVRIIQTTEAVLDELFSIVR